MPIYRTDQEKFYPQQAQTPPTMEQIEDAIDTKHKMQTMEIAKLLENDELFELEAKAMAKKVHHLIKNDFSRDEALQIVISQTRR